MTVPGRMPYAVGNFSSPLAGDAADREHIRGHWVARVPVFGTDEIAAGCVLGVHEAPPASRGATCPRSGPLSFKP